MARNLFMRKPGNQEIQKLVISSFKTWEGEAPAEPKLRKPLVLAAQRVLRPPEQHEIGVLKLLLEGDSIQ